MDVRKALLIVKLALLLVLALAMAKTIAALWEPAGLAESALAVNAGSTGIPAEPETAAITPEGYAAILRRNIFSELNGSAAMNTSLSDENVAAIMQSAEQELGLVLIGTVAGSPEVSQAIIRDIKSNTVKNYKVGDMVAGARVSSIRRTVVILLHGEQSKILKLHADAKQSAEPAAAIVPLNRSETIEAVNTSRTDENSPVQMPPVLGHLEAMLEAAIIEPYSVNGQTEGLRITGLENIPVAGGIGLKNGDVIRQVNGHLLTDKRKAFQIFRKARTQPVLNIELLREGKTSQLSFSLR